MSEAPTSEPNNLANKSVLKALGILSVLGKFPNGATATDLAEATGNSRPTVFRMLLSLEAASYVERTDATYHLGWELLRLSRLPHLDQGLAMKVKPILDKYAQIVNETVNFALSGPDGSFDIVAEGTARRILTIEEQLVGKPFPPHASSSGKLLLSELSKEQVLRLLPEKLEKFTAHTITSQDALLRELAQIRTQGFAILDGELEIGLYSLSVPVRDAEEKIIGAIASYGPSERMKMQGEQAIAGHHFKAAAEIGRILGPRNSED